MGQARRSLRQLYACPQDVLTALKAGSVACMASGEINRICRHKFVNTRFDKGFVKVTAATIMSETTAQDCNGRRRFARRTVNLGIIQRHSRQIVNRKLMLTTLIQLHQLKLQVPHLRRTT